MSYALVLLVTIATIALKAPVNDAYNWTITRCARTSQRRPANAGRSLWRISADHPAYGGEPRQRARRSRHADQGRRGAECGRDRVARRQCQERWGRTRRSLQGARRLCSPRHHNSSLPRQEGASAGSLVTEVREVVLSDRAPRPRVGETRANAGGHGTVGYCSPAVRG